MLEIIDTAVKIGLGALISGVSTYVVTVRKNEHELTKGMLDAKKDLVKEAVLKYEDAIINLNQASHDARMLGAKNIDKEGAEKIATSFLLAKISMNMAQSFARLAGLVELADCYASYSNGLDELNLMFSDGENINLDEAQRILDDFGEEYRKSKLLVSRAYEDIFA